MVGFLLAVSVGVSLTSSRNERADASSKGWLRPKVSSVPFNMGRSIWASKARSELLDVPRHHSPNKFTAWLLDNPVRT